MIKIRKMSDRVGEDNGDGVDVTRQNNEGRVSEATSPSVLFEDEPLVVVKYHKGKMLARTIVFWGPTILFFWYCLVRSIMDMSFILLLFSFLLSICGLINLAYHANVKNISLYKQCVILKGRTFLKKRPVYLKNAIYTAHSKWPGELMLVANANPPGVVYFCPGLISQKDRKGFYKTLASLTGRSPEDFKRGWNKCLMNP